MRSIQLLALVYVVLAGCAGKSPEYGRENPLYLPGSTRQTWAVAPVVNLSGQRGVDPVLQADLLYNQLQQVAGLTVIPVNRVIQVYHSLRIEQIQSEQQAALVCDILGCDALLVGTVSLYEPYDPPKMGASLHLFRKDPSYQRPPNIDIRELVRQAVPPANAAGSPSDRHVQAVGVFDSANGSTRAEVMAYAAGRNDPKSPYREKAYLVDMDRYGGFVYHNLLEELLQKPALMAMSGR
jgi:hypothetical protein